MGLLDILTAAWTVLALTIRLHHKPSLDCVEALGGCSGVTRLAVDCGSRRDVDVSWLLLPIKLIIHNDGVHVLAEGGRVLF